MKLKIRKIKDNHISWDEYVIEFKSVCNKIKAITINEIGRIKIHDINDLEINYEQSDI